MKAFEIKATIYFDPTPGLGAADGRWIYDYDVFVDGHELGGTLSSVDSLSQALAALSEDLRAARDIVPSTRWRAKKMFKWLTYMRKCMG